MTPDGVPITVTVDRLTDEDGNRIETSPSSGDSHEPEVTEPEVTDASVAQALLERIHRRLEGDPADLADLMDIYERVAAVANEKTRTVAEFADRLSKLKEGME